MDAGKGYRLLVRGEVKITGDEWKYRSDKNWHPVICVGDKFTDTDPGYRFVRRKVSNV